MKQDAFKIFMQADGFHRACERLMESRPTDDRNIIASIGPPSIVLTAFTSELFLKCLVCIETGKAPRGHNLRLLFDKLKPATRAALCDGWDREFAPLRAAMWDQIEKDVAAKIPRDLPTLLERGSNAFEKVRYLYEGNLHDVEYFLTDLPPLLGRTVMAMKPEWHLRQRDIRPVV